MNSTTALPLFEEDPEQAEVPAPPVHLGMAAVPARLVAYRDTQHEDGLPRALLVVVCPFRDHQRIHAAGLASAPRVCPRTSRCIARPTGVYHLPEVQRGR